MALSINPLAQLVSQVSTAVSQATSEAQSAISASSIGEKVKLDSTIDRLSGGITSGYNGITAGASNITSGLGGLTNSIQSSISSGISTLQSAAGSISNVTADIAGGLNKLTGGNLAGGLQQAAGAISGAAGQLNNILSLVRGSKLPQGGELFLKQSAPVTLTATPKDDWRVRITTNFKLFNSALFGELEKTGGVVWPYLPEITVSTKAEYNTINPVHGNYSFQSYKNSVVDDIQITGEFSCETQEDALYWIAATTFFKTATKMFFGSSEFAGNPPVICRLTGYGASVFDNVPVVVKSFSVDLKSDVNYIKCDLIGTSTWVPVLSTISVTVSPIYNRTNLRKFSLQNYARGQMAGENQVGYL
jgi:hypothetical protein